MNTSLVMTIIGEDEPGLVESIAQRLTEHGGNWLESRMARLGGQFAGILRIEVPREKQESLIAALRSLESRGLTVVVQPGRSLAATSGKTICRLEIVGQDRPGIIHEISRALARRGVNVEELETKCASAAMSGETIFTARAEVTVPPSCDLADLRKELDKIAGDLIVEVSFEPLPAPVREGPLRPARPPGGPRLA